MMPNIVFMEFLRTLRDEANVRVCGSFASGTYDMKPGFLSDIDFVVQYVDREDEYGNPVVRPIDKAMEIFKRFDVPGDSIFVGQWSSPRDLETLPRPVEVMESWLIQEDESYPQTVSIFGLRFQTYRVDKW